jgi:hypothetical protein
LPTPAASCAGVDQTAEQRHQAERGQHDAGADQRDDARRQRRPQAGEQQQEEDAERDQLRAASR